MVSAGSNMGVDHCVCECCLDVLEADYHERCGACGAHYCTDYNGAEGCHTKQCDVFGVSYNEDEECEMLTMCSKCAPLMKLVDLKELAQALAWAVSFADVQAVILQAQREATTRWGN